jgi:hypothetical protein
LFSRKIGRCQRDAGAGFFWALAKSMKNGEILQFFKFCCDAKKAREIDKLSVDVVEVHT